MTVARKPVPSRDQTEATLPYPMTPTTDVQQDGRHGSGNVRAEEPAAGGWATKEPKHSAYGGGPPARAYQDALQNDADLSDGWVDGRTGEDYGKQGPPRKMGGDSTGSSNVDLPAPLQVRHHDMFGKAQSNVSDSLPDDMFVEVKDPAKQRTPSPRPQRSTNPFLRGSSRDRSPKGDTQSVDADAESQSSHNNNPFADRAHVKNSSHEDIWAELSHPSSLTVGSRVPEPTSTQHPSLIPQSLQAYTPSEQPHDRKEPQAPAPPSLRLQDLSGNDQPARSYQAFQPQHQQKDMPNHHENHDAYFVEHQSAAAPEPVESAPWLTEPSGPSQPDPFAGLAELDSTLPSPVSKNESPTNPSFSPEFGLGKGKEVVQDADNAANAPVPTEEPPAPKRTKTWRMTEAQLQKFEEQKKETYQIKHIRWQDHRSSEIRTSPIMVQNANGPCPLLALVNALALSTMPGERSGLIDTLRVREQVSLNLLLDAVFDELTSGQRGVVQELPDVSDLYNFMGTLHNGMNVNPQFTNAAKPPTSLLDDIRLEENPYPAEIPMAGGFEHTTEMEFYSVFQVPLIHGWIPPTGDPAVPALRRSANTYEDAQALISREDELDSKLQREGLSSNEQQLFQDITLIKLFLESSRTQLTQYGIDTIAETMAPAQVAIFFRNDHFSTLYKHPQSGQLLALVTDMGYAGHDEVVWESLSDVSGERSEFYAGDFRPVGHQVAEAQRQSEQRRQQGESNGSRPLRVTNPTHTPASQPPPRSSSTRHPHQQTGVIDEAGEYNLTATRSSEQEDADLALALQLQEEEEDRSRRANANRLREEEERLSNDYIAANAASSNNNSPAQQRLQAERDRTSSAAAQTGRRRSSNTPRPQVLGPASSSLSSSVSAALRAGNASSASSAAAAMRAQRPAVHRERADEGGGDDEAPPSYEVASKTRPYVPGAPGNPPMPHSGGASNPSMPHGASNPSMPPGPSMPPQPHGGSGGMMHQQQQPSYGAVTGMGPTSQYGRAHGHHHAGGPSYHGPGGGGGEASAWRRRRNDGSHGGQGSYGGQGQMYGRDRDKDCVVM